MTIAHIRPPGAPGFTLVELMLGLLLGAVLFVIAIPGYRAWIADEQLLDHARLIAQSMNLARSEAIKRGHRVNLCKSGDGIQCTDTGTWDQGFIMHADPEANGEADQAADVLRFEPPPVAIRVSANRPLANYVSYTSLGQARMLNGALQMGTFTVCKTGRHPVEIVLVASGRVRIDRLNTICP